MKKVQACLIMLLMLLSITGCGNEKILSYGDENDIEITQEADEKMARITITDSYTKDCKKYLVFTTNISGNEEFTLSEDEYDEYIGLENDAVDCTVYNLQCNSDVFSYKFSIIRDIDLESGESLEYMLNKITDIEAYHSLMEYIRKSDSNTVQIREAYNTQFAPYEYSFHFYRDDDNSQIDITSTMNVSRYSFTGKSDFTDEEISQYTEIMNQVNVELVNLCDEAIYNDRY